MADPIRNYQTSAVPGVRADIDQGLRAYMIKVYNLMGLGLLITGLAAVGTIMQLSLNGGASLPPDADSLPERKFWGDKEELKN